VVEQDPQAKFAAQPEAAKYRVENCSKEDADDLTPAQPEELSPETKSPASGRG